jgi:hypothetical protein
MATSTASPLSLAGRTLSLPPSRSVSNVPVPSRQLAYIIAPWHLHSQPALQPASQEAINNLEHVTLGKDKLQETDTTCPVCSDSFEDVSASGSSAKRMPCGHLFHDECLLPWLSRGTFPCTSFFWSMLHIS